MPSRRTAAQRRRTSGPLLAGVRVIDFTRRYAGPFATLLLAALGAEVIKIESQRQPDPYRGRSGNFQATNYNKKSCTLNLNKEEARGLLRRLVAISDVVADSFAAGVMERFGFTFEDLRQVRPDLITITMSGFGQTGPYREYLAYGPVGSSFGGVDAVTGFPGGRPVTAGGPLDGLCSETLAFGTLVALFHRRLRGTGQHVETAMHEVQLAVAPESLLEYVANGRISGPKGNRDNTMAPHGFYPCEGKDAWLAVAVSSDDEWRALCGGIGRPELASDSRFATTEGRLNNQDALDTIMTEWSRHRGNTEAMEALQQAGVPAAGCQNVIQLLEQDPHLKARDMFIWLNTGANSQVAVQRLPGDVKGDLQCIYTRAPRLGEHNEYVFKELLGLSPAEYDRLVEQQVIH